MSTESNNLFRLTIQPTNKCNLACTYCYQTNKGKKDLEFANIKIVIDKLFDHDNDYFNGFLKDAYNGVILDFIGGEATLNMTLVSETVAYFIRQCCVRNKPIWLHTLQIWLETNGTTYFRSDVQEFIRKYHEKLDLPITIDGSKSLHDSCRVYHDGRGSYDDVERAVKAYIQDFKVPPNTKITLSPSNVRQMFDGIKNMIALGYRSCRISFTYNERWSKEDDEAFVQQLSLYYDYVRDNNINFLLYPLSHKESYGKGIRCATCGADGSSVCVDCNGNLFLCQAFSDICDMRGRSVSVGTVESGITDKGLQWMKHILERNMRLNLHRDECTDCPCNSVCEYCPAVEYMLNAGTLTDTPHIFTSNCAKHKAAYALLKQREESRSHEDRFDISLP